MVLGSIIFAAARGKRLRHLLAFSTTLIGLSYIGLAAAPSLVAACAVSVAGGAGNGIQWVSLVSAVQELTSERMQARVMGVLESLGAAMPGIGFLLGGLITHATDPRVAFLVAGLGVLMVVVMVGGIFLAIPASRREPGRDPAVGLVKR